MSYKPRYLTLLAAAMDEQPWDPPDEVPSAERYVRALSGVEPLTAEEKEQLLLSPTARLHFQMARTGVLAAKREKFQRQGYQTDGIRLAADDGTDGLARIETEDFVLSVERDDSDPDHPEWMVIVELKERMRADLVESGLCLALLDLGGRTWLVGTPDERGVMSGIWEFDDSPVARLAAHAVRLNVV